LALHLIYFDHLLQACFEFNFPHSHYHQISQFLFQIIRFQNHFPASCPQNSSFYLYYHQNFHPLSASFFYFFILIISIISIPALDELFFSIQTSLAS